MSPVFNTPWITDWRPEFVGTLLFIVRPGEAGQEVLLIHKKTGHGRGMVNGPGGKLEPGESTLECAVRECSEEVGLLALDVRCCCEMRFVELDGPQWLGFGFVANAYSGDLRPSAEADPFWCPVADIPYSNMWPDDKVWLPDLLKAPASPQVQVGNYLFRDGDLLEHEFVDEPSVWDSFRLSPL